MMMVLNFYSNIVRQFAQRENSFFVFGDDSLLADVDGFCEEGLSP